jgi:demethylmenaquinone methyltransferase / 2-methoxy-6-polyprenyl-1,4-benzoquinol methylase
LRPHEPYGVNDHAGRRAGPGSRAGNADGAADTPGSRVGRGAASPEEKVRYIRGMFGAIAPRYDLANTLLSAGLHRWWKRITADLAALPAGGRAVDVCCGTGDLARLLARRAGTKGLVLGMDFSLEMLRVARQRAAAAGVDGMCRFVAADAHALPAADGTFDAATVGFGLRNVARPEAALREMWRVLRPGGRLAVLEFSVPQHRAVRRLYDLYSFTMVPWLGRAASRHPDAYLYLPTSVRHWPDQEAFGAMLRSAGFAEVRYRNFASGITAVHLAIRPPTGEGFSRPVPHAVSGVTYGGT